MMLTKAKKIGVFIVGAVGFVSAVIGLWAYFYSPTPDSETWLVPNETSDVALSQDNLPHKKFIKGNEIIVDGEKVTLPKGAIILSNKISLLNGAELFGDSITLVTTQLDGGRVSSTRARGDRNGGDLLIVAAIINGTHIESNGVDGRDGRNGADGSNGKAGSDGRNGRCDGFGRWKKAKPGGNGENGGNGEAGEDGERGGDAGSIVILTSYEPTVQPVALGGSGGRGGQGGAAGRGGSGGKGGSGCSGLGGSQDGRASGAKGTDGNPGKDGRDGAKGQDRNPTIKRVEFTQVQDIVKMHEEGDGSALISSIRAIRPADR